MISGDVLHRAKAAPSVWVAGDLPRSCPDGGWGDNDWGEKEWFGIYVLDYARNRKRVIWQRIYFPKKSVVVVVVYCLKVLSTWLLTVTNCCNKL